MHLPKSKRKPRRLECWGLYQSRNSIGSFRPSRRRSPRSSFPLSGPHSASLTFKPKDLAGCPMSRVLCETWGSCGRGGPHIVLPLFVHHHERGCLRVPHVSRSLRDVGILWAGQPTHCVTSLCASPRKSLPHPCDFGKGGDFHIILQPS